MVARPGLQSPWQRRGPDIPKIEASGAIFSASAGGRATYPSRAQAAHVARRLSAGAHFACQERRFSSLALIACVTITCQDCFP